MSEPIFTEIYRKRRWSSQESVSGTGSELRATVNIRKQIPKVFHRYEIYKVLDVGCGDVNWMKEIWDHFSYYLGVDVVEDIIEQNQGKYESDLIEFYHGDIQFMDLSDHGFDVVILSDVLVHLSYVRIVGILHNLRRSNIQYILMTHFTGVQANRDIKTGDWRPLNMMLPPFHFPVPLEVIAHNDEPVKIAQTKTLALWKL